MTQVVGCWRIHWFNGMLTLTGLSNGKESYFIWFQLTNDLNHL